MKKYWIQYRKIKGLQNNQKRTIQTQTLKPNSGGLEQLVTNLSSWLRWTSVKFSTTYNNSGKDIWDYCRICQQSLPIVSNIAKRISIMRTKQPDVYAFWTQRVKYHIVIRAYKNWTSPTAQIQHCFTTKTLLRRKTYLCLYINSLILPLSNSFKPTRLTYYNDRKQEEFFKI